MCLDLRNAPGIDGENYGIMHRKGGSRQTLILGFKGGSTTTLRVLQGLCVLKGIFLRLHEVVHATSLASHLSAS